MVTYKSGTPRALEDARGGRDAVHDCGDLAGVVAARIGQRVHARQLHLRPAGHRAGPVRGWAGQRTANSLEGSNRPSCWLLANSLAVAGRCFRRDFIEFSPVFAFPATARALLRVSAESRCHDPRLPSEPPLTLRRTFTPTPTCTVARSPAATAATVSSAWSRTGVRARGWVHSSVPIAAASTSMRIAGAGC